MDKNECVLLENGNMYKLKDDDILQDDHTAVIEGYGFSRPNSWFKVVSSVYAPHNCEQLTYNILHFLISKTLFAKQLEQEKKKNIYQFNFEEFHKSNKRFQTEKKETEEVQPLSLPKMEPVEDPQDDSCRFSLQKVLDEYSATNIQRDINPLLVCISSHK